MLYIIIFESDARVSRILDTIMAIKLLNAETSLDIGYKVISLSKVASTLRPQRRHMAIKLLNAETSSENLDIGYKVISLSKTASTLRPQRRHRHLQLEFLHQGNEPEHERLERLR